MKAPWAFSSRSPRCTGRSRDPNAKIGKLRHIGGSHLLPVAPSRSGGGSQAWRPGPLNLREPQRVYGAPNEWAC